MFYTFLGVTYTMRSNKKNLRTVHFLMSEVEYFPGTQYLCSEKPIFNFASKDIFLSGKPFLLFFFFVQSALNNNVSCFSLIYPASWSLQEKKAPFGVPFRIILTSSTMLWILKTLSVRIGCIYQFKTNSVSKHFACHPR